MPDLSLLGRFDRMNVLTDADRIVGVRAGNQQQLRSPGPGVSLRERFRPIVIAVADLDSETGEVRRLFRMTHARDDLTGFDFLQEMSYDQTA
ncbi:hypothetical protein Elgi_29760 [Paenibacillus elgii]|nr:hypothetical protein Elgi_29760 [Paenibacillus elgii]